MQPKQILDDQRITVKRGRMNGLGFEPAHNSFFDFYLNSRYVDPPLLQLEDVTFFLFLRKNINDTNPDWQMPSVRHIMRRFRIGYAKYKAMLFRLSRAKLLVKISGVNQAGNTPNTYVLSDPISYLDEFLTILDAGLFDPVSEMETGGVPETEAPAIDEMETGGVADPEALNILPIKQTHKQIWFNVLSVFKQHMIADSFHLFLEGATLAIEGDVATITTATNAGKSWVENRLSKRLVGMLNMELRMAGLCEIKSLKVESIH